MSRHTSRDPSSQLFYEPSDTLRRGRLRDAHMSSSTSSASKTATYCSIGGPGPPTYYDQKHALQSYHNEPCAGSSSRLKLSSRHATIFDDRSSSSASVTRTVYYNRPTTMVSISNTSADRRPTSSNSNLSTEGIVYPCGGHCRTFERCFHYFLQFFFVIGILGGVSLVLAAYRLHHQRPSGDDQFVMVYIGVVIALVCLLLLSIQCSVEREVKRKKRKRRIAISLARNNRNRLQQVPLRTMESDRNVYTEMAVVPPASHTSPPMTTVCQMPLINEDYHYSTQQSISEHCSNDDMDKSQNGIPWWRRNEGRVAMKNKNLF